MISSTKAKKLHSYFGTESISSLAPKVWEIKNAKSLDIFKEKIKLWTTDKYPCRLCKR